jgi:hypothetical protein
MHATPADPTENVPQKIPILHPHQIINRPKKSALAFSASRIGKGWHLVVTALIAPVAIFGEMTVVVGGGRWAVAGARG